MVPVGHNSSRSYTLNRAALAGVSCGFRRKSLHKHATAALLGQLVDRFTAIGGSGRASSRRGLHSATRLPVQGLIHLTVLGERDHKVLSASCPPSANPMDWAARF